MTAPNLGWMFYKKLYDTRNPELIEMNKKTVEGYFSFDYLKSVKRELTEECTKVLKKRSQQFFDKKLVEYNSESFFKCEATTNSFELTTTYPGLLCGVGYNHGISSEADFKVGFYFDHTTGLPVIPGSSVKGVLRSAFPGYIRKDDDNRPSKKLMEERYKFFRWMVEEVNSKTGANISLFSNKEIDTLEAFIFEGQDSEGKQISYYERDRFFDAYPVRSLGHDGCFLKNDYITPHINREKPEMSPFSNPNPIQFLKVLPKVQFRFQFQLKKGGGLDEKQKELLFKEILCFMGAGAKTNVGYGQFTDKEPVDDTISDKTGKEERKIENLIPHTPVKSPDPIIKKYSKITGEYTEGEQYKATILKEVDAHFIFQIGDDNFVKSIANIEKKFKKDAGKRISKGKSGNYKTLEVGDELFIRINDVSEMNFTVLPIWID